MAEIDAHARNIRELLGGKKYTIDYFQRQYRWRTKEIQELITDLTARFLSAWKPTHGRSDVAKYSTYFLGSIIVSGEDGKASVIDGQQRLTSISILLIWVLHGLEHEEDRKQIGDLIFTRQYGTNDYNLNVPERTAAMEALYKQEAYNRDGAPESVRNILDRYDDIGELMPKEVAGQARAMFADWLIERVYLVEIKTPSDDDGYAIFETMNDRGLPLSPTDMLKSHLLANSGDDETKIRLNAIWKNRIDELLQIDKEGEADAIKSWLRGRHAESIREREAGAQPQDFDRIGTEFHRWVRDKGKELGLKATPDFARFVERDFDFYTSWYLRLVHATRELSPSHEAIYCNALANFTLQYPLMLATINTADSEEIGWRKANVAATFVDILIARRLWNGKGIDYNTMRSAMFLALKDIRGKSPEAVAALLRTRLEQDPLPFNGNPRFGLWESHKKTIRRFLARMTAWLEVQIGDATNLEAYLMSSGKNGYDIEHVIPDSHAPYISDFPLELDFKENRNRIGGLLLLPNSVNRSLQGLSYEDKLPHYLKENALARSLHEQAYERKPAFLRLIAERTLPFEFYAVFRKDQLENRQQLYIKLAEQVWSLDRLEYEAHGGSGA